MIYDARAFRFVSRVDSTISFFFRGGKRRIKGDLLFFPSSVIRFSVFVHSMFPCRWYRANNFCPILWPHVLLFGLLLSAERRSVRAYFISDV